MVGELIGGSDCADCLGGFVVGSLTTDAQERLFSEVLLKLLTDSSAIVRCGSVFFGWNVIVELNLISGV